jgi:V8-like Glu-specific endopeptidase
VGGVFPLPSLRAIIKALYFKNSIIYFNNMKRKLILFSALIAYQCASGQVKSKLDTIADIHQEPYSHVCYQEIYRVRKFGIDRSFQSTGFLIAPNVILTAGHNLLSNSLTKVTNIKVFPGRYKNEYAYDSIELSGEFVCQNAIRVYPDFYWNKMDYDFAIIIIPDSLIAKTKHWPKASSFILDSSFVLKENEVIHVAGFPASHGYDGSLMTNESQKCGKVNDNNFSHNLDTQTGNSGSPIWVESNGKRIVVGVHTYANVGTKLSEDYIKLIFQWMHKN